MNKSGLTMVQPTFYVFSSLAGTGTGCFTRSGAQSRVLWLKLAQNDGPVSVRFRWLCSSGFAKSGVFYLKNANFSFKLWHRERYQSNKPIHGWRSIMCVCSVESQWPKTPLDIAEIFWRSKNINNLWVPNYKQKIDYILWISLNIFK